MRYETEAYYTQPLGALVQQDRSLIELRNSSPDCGWNYFKTEILEKVILISKRVSF